MKCPSRVSCLLRVSTDADVSLKPSPTSTIVPPVPAAPVTPAAPVVPAGPVPATPVPAPPRPAAALPAPPPVPAAPLVVFESEEHPSATTVAPPKKTTNMRARADIDPTATIHLHPRPTGATCAERKRGTQPAPRINQPQSLRPSSVVRDAATMCC